METANIVRSLVGALLFVLGFIIIRFKAVWLISIYRPDKFNEDKLCNIIGSHLMFAGAIFVFFNVLIGFLAEDLRITITIIMHVVFLSIIARVVLCSLRHARISNK